jgi:hypothetical protein
MANYLRTCTKCGDSWDMEDTGAEAKGSTRRVRDRADIAQGEQLEAAMESYRACPECASRDFRDERAKRKRSST